MELVDFVCNLCGTENRVAAAALSREVPSCRACGSTVRFRSIAQLLVRELIGFDEILPRLPRRSGVIGLGLSDSGTYATPLARTFAYTNTFFHKPPRLDITEIPDLLAGRHDFVIASDVFEHVRPPASRAFAGARRLLKPDGVFVLTVPFSLDGDTIEHFPDLHDFRIEGTGAAAVLHNTTRDGRVQCFDQLVFHGGIGATLEMREFSRAGLERELEQSGLSRVTFCGDACPRFGIVWQEPWSIPIVARP